MFGCKPRFRRLNCSIVFWGTVVGCQICQISTNLRPGNCLCPSRILWEGVERSLVIGFGFEGGLREVEGSLGQAEAGAD